MRLVRVVERLEVAERKRRRAERRVGMIWSADDVELDRELGPGETLAVDLHVGERVGLVLAVRAEERVSAGAGDLGVVYDRGGAVLGRVVGVEGRIVSIEWVGGVVSPFRWHARSRRERADAAGPR